MDQTAKHLIRQSLTRIGELAAHPAGLVVSRVAKVTRLGLRLAEPLWIAMLSWLRPRLIVVPRSS